mgnify:CR=1 FL=1
MSNTLQENQDYKKYMVDSKLQYYKPHATKIEKTFSQEISASLNCKSKFISPKFFYDKKGSELFEKICTLPEYYPTRTEVSILEKLHAPVGWKILFSKQKEYILMPSDIVFLKFSYGCIWLKNVLSLV